MTEKRKFWIALEAGAILLYGVIIGGSYLLNQPKPGWILIGLLVLLHLTEMPTALRIGQEKGLHPGRVIILNMLFGFTWWLPLSRGILE
jgi:hypothetical protein